MEKPGLRGPGLVVIPLVCVLGGVTVRNDTAMTSRSRKWGSLVGRVLVLRMHFINFSKGACPPGPLVGCNAM